MGGATGFLRDPQSFLSHEEIPRLYPYLAAEDIREALSYAAWRVEELEVPLAVA